MATSRQKLMANKTSSKVPKTEKQKKMWIQARRIAVKESGAQSEESVPWGLVQKIYENAKKAGKVPKQADVKKAKVSKTVKAYATPDKRKERAIKIKRKLNKG